MPFGLSSKTLRLRRSDESKHFLTVGDTGTGKSTLLRQLLHYAQACGDTCVVLDSKLEFIPEFYDPRRGDKILSPKDQRCVWWDFANEVTDEVDAFAASRAMYPLTPGNFQGKWFEEHACRIAAYLWTYSNPRPSCEQFGRWLTNPETEIFPRLKGSEHEHTLNKNADSQLAGLLGTLNQVGMALRMMPRDAEMSDRERFTIRLWAQDPKGWLFLPNTAETRDALRPLQSGWVDMCIYRIMSSSQRSQRVWIVLDELDSLGTLSKLQDGMTQLRSTGHPMALGIQNLSQLQDRYGAQSDTIFSQAGSKVIFAVSEPKSAKTLEQLLGEVEIRRFRESRTGSLLGRNDRNNFSGPEDVRKPLVMASEIQGLPDLTGYFMQRPADEGTGLHVVPIKLAWRKPIFRCSAFVERAIPPMSAPVVARPETPSASTANSTLAPEARTAPPVTPIAQNPITLPTWTTGTPWRGPVPKSGV